MKFDLHSHSNMSDGTQSPADLVKVAKACGLSLFALTDHDTVAGVGEAVAEGTLSGLNVLGGVEFDAEFPTELHILGLGIDITNGPLCLQLEQSSQKREARNALILEKLKAMGIDLSPHMNYSKGNTTRFHIAIALRDAGYTSSAAEAFQKYVGTGCPAYVAASRPSPEQVIALIRGAGGTAVLAHPCKLKCDAAPLIKRLCDAGLGGLEAYYPAATPGQVQQFSSFAAQYGLLITCGSDYHGSNRKEIRPGCAWRDVDALERTYDFLMSAYFH